MEGNRATHTAFDEAAQWARLINAARDTIRVRRERYVQDIAVRYGVTLYPHPYRAGEVLAARTDYDYLVDSIATDPFLSPVGRGYYTGLGGELSVVPVPDWTCDGGLVALARGYAVARRPFMGPIRALARAAAALGGRGVHASGA